MIELVHTVISEIIFRSLRYIVLLLFFFDWCLNCEICNLTVRDSLAKWLLMPELKNLQLIITLAYFSEYCLNTFCLLVPVVVNYILLKKANRNFVFYGFSK